MKEKFAQLLIIPFFLVSLHTINATATIFFENEALCKLYT